MTTATGQTRDDALDAEEAALRSQITAQTLRELAKALRRRATLLDDIADQITGQDPAIRTNPGQTT